MPAEGKTARELVDQFAQTAKRHPGPASPPPPVMASAEPDLASAVAETDESGIRNAAPYTRLYVSWETADRLDAEHRALRRRVQGRISKLQLVDALIAVALTHPEEVLAELRRRPRGARVGD